MKISTTKHLVLVFIYKAMLDLSFVFFLLPVYGGTTEITQTSNGDLDVSKLVVSYVSAVVSFAWLETIMKDRYRASRFVMLVQFLVVIVPFTSLYALLNYPSWQFGLILLGFLLPVTLIRVMKAPHIPLLGQDGKIILAVVIGLVVFYTYAGLIGNGGLGRINFNLLKVYEFRAEASEHAFFLSGYVIPWVAYVFNMAALAYFIGRYRAEKLKSGVGIFVVLLLQVLLFGMTNSKTFLFLPFAILGLMFCLKRMRLQRAALIGVTVACLVLIGVYFFWQIPLAAGIMDRMLVVPAALHSLYFSFFSTHPLGLLQGTVGGLFGSTYQENIVFVVAQHYWKQMFSPNVGWIADAYANFGVLGIIAFSVILACALRVADSMSNRNIQPGVAEGILFGFAFGLTNAALLTSLLTGGFLAAIAALWLMRSHES